MIFDKTTKNQVTEFTCRRGDEVCTVTFEYNIECMEHVAKAFDTIATFLGFSNDTVAQHYIDNNPHLIEGNVIEDEED